MMDWTDFQQSPLILIFACVAGFVFALPAVFMIKKWGRSLRFLDWSLDLSLLSKPVLSLIPALFVVAASERLVFDAPGMSILRHMIRVWSIASFGWLAVNLLDVIMRAILRRYDMTAADNLKARQVHTQIQVIHKILAVFIFLITAALALITFNSVKQVGVSILASAGVFGIIIGFAAQKTLGNLIAGIQIALAQPIRLDDVVVVEGEWGRIEEIALTYVVVKIWDERRLVLPISYFTEKPFQNWTRTTSKIIGSVFIYTDYRMPVEPLRAKLNELLDQSKLWDRDVRVLQVTNTTDRSMELRALMSAAGSGQAWDLRCEVREGLIAYMQQEYPEYLPKTRVELKEMPRRQEPAGS